MSQEELRKIRDQIDEKTDLEDLKSIVYALIVLLMSQK